MTRDIALKGIEFFSIEFPPWIHLSLAFTG